MSCINSGKDKKPPKIFNFADSENNTSFDESLESQLNDKTPVLIFLGVIGFMVSMYSLFSK